MALLSQCLCGNARLQAVALNNPAMFVGETGFAVALVQKSLVDLGYKLPISVGAEGLPDGIFGNETLTQVKAFQDWAGLKIDGIVGRLTITGIDAILAKDERPSPWLKFKIEGLPAPGNLPEGVKWEADQYRADVRSVILRMNSNSVFRAILDHILGRIRVRPGKSAKTEPYWSGLEEYLFYTPYLFWPGSPLYEGPPSGPKSTERSRMIVWSDDMTFCHELVHAMLFSRGSTARDTNVPGIVHPIKIISKPHIFLDKLFFGNFGDFIAIVVANTFLSLQRRGRPIEAIARNRLLLVMDHHAPNQHRPLRSPETFHETPEIRDLLLKVWAELDTFARAVAENSAPFNPLRDVRK